MSNAVTGWQSKVHFNSMWISVISSGQQSAKKGRRVSLLALLNGLEEWWMAEMEPNTWPRYTLVER